MIKVFKLGGASINSADAIKNLAVLINRQSNSAEPLLIVISALGKTTNALEEVVNKVHKQEPDWNRVLQKIKDQHFEIINALFDQPSHRVYDEVHALFDQLEKDIRLWGEMSYDELYDQVVCYGELVSTHMVSAYLKTVSIPNLWIDAREYIITDAAFREGKVNWDQTQTQIQHKLKDCLLQHKKIITQGFIASTSQHRTTTLGREGSDYSAAIFAFALDAQSVTIWKDVPGFLNADPKYYPHTVKLEKIPYREAIELSYYGATIIHPKTIKPLENKKIPLYVKSFLNPEDSGSLIGNVPAIIPQIPSYIFKNDQVLLSIYPKDFSFITENALCELFGILAKHSIKVNLMQNSAISFSICVDKKDTIFSTLMDQLKQNFRVKYNKQLQLITIRYYTQEVIDEIVGNKKIVLEQKSRVTAQIIVREM